MRYYVVMVETLHHRCGCELTKKTPRAPRKKKVVIANYKPPPTPPKRYSCGKWLSPDKRAKGYVYVSLNDCPNLIEEKTWDGYTGYRSSGQMTVYSSANYAKAALKRITHNRYNGNEPNGTIAKILSFDTVDLIEVTDDQWVLYQARERQFGETGAALEAAKKRAESGT